jgi:predicted aldo/keto reductase-like oxidoreductase
MEFRTFGKTGFRTSVVGFGGLLVAGMSQEEADRTVAWAIDRGVNYLDFAPTYADAEERLGPALKGRREGIFLACKTTERGREGAWRELHRSLDRLGTDHFDLYQLHGVRNMKELDLALGPGGAIEVLVEAKQQGLTRFIGITTHWTDVALSALSRFDFDTILFPVNFACWYAAGVGADVLERAAEKGIGRMALKSMALGPLPEGASRTWSKCWYQPTDEPGLAELAVRFTLSQDVSLLIPPGHVELFEMALDAADRFRPLDPDEARYLRRLSVEVTSEVGPLFTRQPQG